MKSRHKKLALIGGALAMLAGPSAPVPVPAPQIIAAPQRDERLREAPRGVRPLAAAPPSVDAALDMARRDPARAAAVVRGWMNGKEDPA